MDATNETTRGLQTNATAVHTVTPEEAQQRIATIYHEKFFDPEPPEHVYSQNQAPPGLTLAKPQNQQDNANGTNEQAITPTRTPEGDPYPPQPHHVLNNLFQSAAFRPCTLAMTPAHMQDLLTHWNLRIIALSEPVWEYTDHDGRQLYTLGLMIYLGDGLWIPVRRFGNDGKFWVNLDPNLENGAERLGRKGLDTIVARIRDRFVRRRERKLAQLKEGDVDEDLDENGNLINREGLGIYKLMGKECMANCVADEALRCQGLEWPLIEDMLEDENDLLLEMDSLQI